MANVLPVKRRRESRKRYWFRLTLTGALIFSAALIIGITALLPAYTKAKIERDGALRFKELQEEARKAAKEDSTVKVARLVRTQIDVLVRVHGTQASSIVEQMLEHFKRHQDDIIITSIQYKSEEAGTKKEREEGLRLRTLRVSGEARDRESLSAFAAELRVDPLFREVRLPVSDLAESSGTRFSIVIVEANT